MTASISVLPIWKKDATLAERLEEMASYIRASPERFSKFMMVYMEEKANGNLQFRTMYYGCTLTESVGLLEIGKDKLIRDSE